MKCKLRLDYKPSNPALIPRHMNTKHKEELMDYEKEQNEKTRKAGTLYQHFHSATPKKLKMASNKNQKQLELLCAMWTATSLRPIKVVEDFFLQHMIDHATATNGKLSLPSRNLNQRNIMKIAEWMTNEIKIQIRREMNFYSTTTDLWSSRRMNALIALTLHYLTEDFQMREFTLECSPVEGNHTSGMIQNLLMTSFERWGLNVDKLTLMLRDGASNGKRACEDWGIKHMSCINHSLHLVVGPFLLFKRKKKEDGDDDIQVDGDDVFMDNEEFWGNDNCIDYVRNIVNDFRLAMKFLKRSIKSKEILERIQHLQQINRFLSVHLDVKTRWNSTYLMLRRMIEMQTTIEQFQVYYRSTEGKRNFRSSKTKFPILNEEKWAIAHGLSYIFYCF